MALNLTDRAFSLSQQSNLEPQIVLEVDGVSTLFGAVIIKEVLKFDDGYEFDSGLSFDELAPVEDQKDYITFDGGTTKLSQSLNPDKGQSSTITSMQLSLVDKNGEITEFISLDDTVSPTFDWLGRKMTIWAGFADSAFPDDFNKIHKGVCDEVKAELGRVVVNIAHPDTKKKVLIFEKSETDLSAGIDDSVTTIPVLDTTGFLKSVIQPDETTLGDDTIKFFVRINDEIIEYTDYDGTNFLSATRGAENTNAAAHDIGDLVESFIVLEGNTIDLALKLMLSGTNGPYLEDLEATNFNTISATQTISNAIWFSDKFLARDYNITANDYVTITGSGEAANNVTGKKINSITTLENGTYLVIDDVSFVSEVDTSAVIDFRSGFDTLGEGIGLEPDDVDIERHDFIRDTFIQNFEQKFYIREEIENAKDFIEQQCFIPAACFSVPRKTRSSLNYHVGPLPTDNLKQLDTTNVKNADKLRIRRTLAKSFKNSIVFKYEESALEQDRFQRNFIRVSADSLNQVPVGKKALVIEAKGLRQVLSADSIADNASFRLLDRYQFGAEIVEGLKMQYATGFNLEIGDIVVYDMTSLKMTDIRTGTRAGKSRLMEVNNFSLDLKTFDVSVNLIDTNFSVDSRYCLMTPTSQIKSASDGLNMILEPEGDPRIGINEYLKWDPYVGAAVRVHNFDHSTVGVSFIKEVNTDNSIVLEDDLGFTPSAGMYLNMDDYNVPQIDLVKLVYGFMSDDDNDFADGGIAYQML